MENEKLVERLRGRALALRSGLAGGRQGLRIHDSALDTEAAAALTAAEARIKMLEAQVAAYSQRMFPIMQGPAVPWSLIAPYEAQAQVNHGNVTDVRTSDGVVFDATLCSVPMAIGLEVRYSRAPASAGDDLIGCLLAEKPFWFDPATNFVHADDGGGRGTRWEPAPPETCRCEHCDGTGDVHSIDGEWRGYCSCRAGTALTTEGQRAERFIEEGTHLGLMPSDKRVFENQAGADEEPTPAAAYWARDIVDRLKERAGVARAEGKGTSVADAVHFEEAATDLALTRQERDNWKGVAERALARQGVIAWEAGEREARLVEALQPFVQMAKAVATDHPGWDHDEFVVAQDGAIRLTMAPFRHAAALVGEQS